MKLRWAFVGYLALSVALIGRHALSDPAGTCACLGGMDPPLDMWALAWWPHAIGHALNPFFSHLVWAPQGVNVAAAAMVPLPSVALYPVTALWGPLAAFNLIVLLSPPLAATAACALCLRLGAAAGPALLGGFLFGFGSYELSQSLGHVNLMLVALLPLLVLVVLRRDELSRRRFVIELGLLLAAQLLISTELLASAVLLGGLALLLAGRLRALLVDLVLAGGLAAAICSPYLLYSVVRAVPHGPPDAGNHFAADLLSFVVPGPATWIGGRLFDTSSWPVGVAENGAYFGVLLLAVAVLCLRSLPGPFRRIAGGTAAVALLASLGSHLFVDGTRVVPLPWALLSRLPVLGAVVPVRLTVYVWLALAAAVALWLSRRGSWRNWALALAAAVLLLPSTSLWRADIPQPAFFQQAGMRRALQPGESALLIPFGQTGPSMLWQAQAGFAFRMPEGYLSGVVPAEYRRAEPLTDLLVRGGVPSAPELSGFLQRHQVRHVVALTPAVGEWRGRLQALGWGEQQLGGVLLFSPPR